MRKYKANTTANSKTIIIEDDDFNPVKAFGIIFVVAIVILVGALCVTMVYSKSTHNSHKNTAVTPEVKRYTGQIQEYGDFQYKYIFSETEDIIDRKPVEITLISYIGESKKVSVPSEIDRLPVTVINNSCFAYTDVETVDIPLSVKTIDSFAFYRCEKLKEVLFDENATSQELLIKDSAFRDCINIGTLYFPYLQLDIKSTAFMNCSSLKFLVFNDMCSLKIGVGAFQSCALENVKLPKRTRVIEDNAFKNCSIKHLDIPKDCEVGDNITLRDGNAYRVTRSSSNKNKNSTSKAHIKETTTKSKKGSTIRGIISSIISPEATTSTTGANTDTTTTSDTTTTTPSTTSVSEPSTERETTTRQHRFWPFF